MKLLQKLGVPPLCHLAIGQTFNISELLVTFYEDDMSNFVLSSFNILRFLPFFITCLILSLFNPILGISPVT
jgi:hypothetical protein